MPALKTWTLIAKSLDENIPVMLLYVLESRGSSPGRPGFSMAVNARGDMEGSIGGGIMEHKLVELAKERLLSYGQASLTGTLRKQIHDKTAAANQSGMICSGEQTILLYPVRREDAGTVGAIIASLSNYQNGTLTLSPEKISFAEKIPDNNYHFVMRSETDWVYREKTGYKNRLFIIGGGHCALALSRLMRSMDFYISAFDDRKQLKTFLENEWAHEKHVIGDYSGLKEQIPSGTHHYVVIMTFGYRTDDLALRSLLDKEFAYAGLLGSEEKMKKMLSEYKKRGLTGKLLQQLHAPVGLAINSRTPEEIAVSIAAEIIREKNRLPA